VYIIRKNNVGYVARHSASVFAQEFTDNVKAFTNDHWSIRSLLSMFQC